MNPPLPWFAAPWESVARALDADRLPAGLLILGRAGVGRAQFAHAVARARLCLQPRPDASACGVCASCREMDAGAHPDFLTVRPEEDKEIIGVDQVRELTRGLTLTAGNKGVRVAIVYPADSLNRTAANALLKTLEEPQPGVTLILIADSARGLPPTVISRCQRLPIPVPTQAQALEWLSGRGQRKDWPLLLALSGGAPIAAERMAEEIGADLARHLQDLLAAAARRADPLAVAVGFAKWPLPRFAHLIGWLAYTLLRASLTGVASDAFQPQELAVLAKDADARRLVLVWREANRAASDAVALNAALVCERLILLFISAFGGHNAEGVG